MTPLKLTPHAVVRLSQRGMADSELELIALVGTEVEGGYLVRRQDVQAVEQTVKRFLDKVRRLAGKRVVIDGERVVTAYHAGRHTERRLLRSAEERDLCR